MWFTVWFSKKIAWFNMRLQNKLLKLPLKAESGLYSLSKVAAVIAGFVLAAMMMLTVADVCGRYFFNSPIKGTWEVIGLLLVCAGTWGLGYCQMEKAHIRINIIVEKFSPRVQALMLSFTYLVGIAAFSLLCWRMFMLAMRYLSTMKGYVSDTLDIPYPPFMFALSIGAGIIVLILIVDLVRSLANVIRR
jgi:TRAP-type C4-dicarboxylate transport system permease small subunit